MLHAGLGLGIILISWARLGTTGNNWGGNESGEGVMHATLVSSAPALPLPSHQPTENIVANDTKSVAQPQPQPESKAAPPIPDAKTIDIPDKSAKSKPPSKAVESPKPSAATSKNLPPHPPSTYKGPDASANTATYADAGHINIPMASIATGSGAGALAVSGGGDFANKYAWYVQAVQRKVQQQWLAYEADPRAAQGRRVYLSFNIRRDGSPADVKVEQSSGVSSLDYSAVNAMRRIDTFVPLPGDYRGGYVSVQFYFDYKR
jgi:periplasmic protein TonB